MYYVYSLLFCIFKYGINFGGILYFCLELSINYFLILSNGFLLGKLKRGVYLINIYFCYIVFEVWKVWLVVMLFYFILYSVNG